MGKASLRRVHWCTTIPAGINDGLETQKEGTPFTFEGATYRIHIGPEETPDKATDYPHRHALISGPTSITRTKALNVIAKYLGGAINDKYCQPLDTTVNQYLAYAWKTMYTRKRKDEESIDFAVKKIKTSGHQVSTARLEEELRITEGLNFVSSKQQLIRTAGRMNGVYDDDSLIELELDPAQNMLDTASVIKTFFDRITELVEANGIQTTFSGLNDNTREQQTAFIICMALLPSLFKRLKDDLPSLFFWGIPRAGKSYMFDNNPSFKKVPMDASGVSRYTTESTQKGLLLDDIKGDVMDKHENYSTLRKLTLGLEDIVKTNGGTQPVRVFVVATSNEEPNFLNSEYNPPEEIKTEEDIKKWKANEISNREAWRRRFVCLKFHTMAPDFDCYEIDWSHVTAKYMIAIAFEEYYNKCSKRIQEKLKHYQLHCHRYHDNQEMKEICEKYVQPALQN